MHQRDFSKICLQARNATQKAAEFIRTQVGIVTETDIEEKETNSFVSYVDKKAEEILVDALSRIIPEAGFLTEEDTIQNEHKEFTWIVDPLDGTTNFLQQIPIFSVSVALEYQGNIVAGIVEDIMQNHTYHSVINGGAWRDQKPIHVSNKTALHKAIIATGFPYSNEGRLHDLIALLQAVLQNARGIRRLGSAALDLTYVACGKLDCFYETTLNHWDIAAGVLLVREAGGTVTDFSGRQEFVEQQQILASNTTLHPVILDMIREVHFEKIDVFKE